MAKNNIATNLTANSNGFVNAIQKANASLATHNKALHRSRVDFRQFTQNAIFGIEDVMSVIGTSGLSGAMRAASNNITMMAMALGGTYGMAVGVAISTTSQLLLLLDDTEERLKKVKAAADAWAARQMTSVKLAEDRVRLEQRLRKVTDPQEYDQMVRAERESIEVLRERVRELGRVIQEEKKAQASAQAMYDELDAGLIVNSIQNVSETLLAVPREIVEEATGQEAPGFNRANRRTTLLAEIDAAQQNIKKYQEAQAAAQAELTQASNNILRIEKERVQTQIQLNNLIQSGAAGSKAFAESMARARQGGFEGAGTVPLSKRDQASYAAMQRKADNLTQSNLRDDFADRRDLAGDELWNQMHDKGFQPQRNQELTMMARSGSLASMEKERLARENRNSELGALWDVYGNEQRQASSGRMAEQISTRDPVSEGLREAGKQPFKEFMRDFGTPENPEQARKLRQYQMQMRDKSPEFHKTMEEVYKKRAELEKKREATREEKEIASNTAQTTELLRVLVDRMPETQEGAFPS